MSTLPDFKKGIDYWTGVDATVDGVLGGFGEGPLPRVEQLSSRLFLLSLLPQLQTFNSPLSASMHQQLSKNKRYLALDVGAGVGRVTKHTLLPLVDDVVTTEPVKHFIETAKREATEGKWTFLEDRSENAVTSSSRQTPAGSGGKKRSHSPEPEEEDEDVQYDKLGNIIPKTKPAWTTVKGKRVWFVQASLNDLNPARPLDGHEAKSLGVVGGGAAGGGGKDFGEKREEDLEFDVIWCQWCLGHLSNPQLVAFLKRCHQSLIGASTHQVSSIDEEEKETYQDPGGVIVVKENVCEDGPGGVGNSVLDEEDSSLTRSNKMWEETFQEAGLKIVKEEVQLGLPEGLFMVKAWALR